MNRQPILTPVLLTTVRTSDREDVSGIVVEPTGRKKTAVIWLHGLSSSFDSGQTMMRLLSAQLARQGIGYFKFNNRSHHIADYANRPAGKTSTYVGQGFERFSDCLRDIDAVVKLVRQRGYRTIYLAGHSTGASKAVYYTSKHPRTVAGLILLGAVSDIPAFVKRYGRAKWKAALKQATALIRQNRRALMPHEYGLMSAARFLSMLKPGSAEDVFQWHNPKAHWRLVASIRQPILFLIGSKDQYLDRPAEQAARDFGHHASHVRSYTSKVLLGAPHGFQGFQYDVSRTIVRWVMTHK